MKKILIIDDDIHLCEELKLIFDNENLLSDYVNNGHDGINLIKKNNYALVLLDLKMPKINGLEVLKIIKKHYKIIKVIIITARMKINIEENIKTNKYEEKILKLADMIIQKPFKIKELISSVYKFIN